VSEVACRADLWYTRGIKLFGFSVAGNNLKPEYNPSERLYYGNSTPSIPALQAHPYFPLDIWRKVMASPQKGTPEYDAWRQKLSDSAKKRFSDPEERQKFLENGKKGRFVKGQVAHNKGEPMSEEQKAKLRALPPNKEAIAKMAATKRGKKLSPEHRAKIAEAGKGREFTPEVRAKISASNKGQKRSPETIEKVAASKRGKPSHMKGKTHTDEARKKIKAARGKQIIHKGYKHDEAFRAKASARNRKYWQTATEDQKRAHLDKLHEAARDITNSSIENLYADKLDAQGIVYERQYRIGWYRVDFYVPAETRVIEIAGCYWHCCEQCGYADAHKGKREKDAKRYEYLRRKGYTVDIIWEHELR
jgi:very-short-patch-repair endonuclease